MSLDSLRIGQRLSLGFASVVACLLAMTALAVYSLDSAQQAARRVVAMEHRAAVTDEWLANTRLNVSRMLGIAKSGLHPEVDAYFKPLMAETSQRITELQQVLEREIASDRGKQLLAEIGQRRLAYVKLRNTYIDTLKGGDTAAAAQLLNSSLLPAADAYTGGMVELQRFQRQLVGEAIAQSAATVSHQVQVVLGLALCAVVLAGLGAWVITRSVTVPVGEAVALARAVAQGDLTRVSTTTRRDELGELLQALSDMRHALTTTVSEVRATTDSMHTASAEIASGNLDLSARTEQTASSLQQTAASMEQITATVQQSADSARQAGQMAAGAAEVAVRGGQMVGKVIESMGHISGSSQRIAEITAVIDGIAFQTNILALNAAVEAARAGDHGRGFAVVASEVRRLAQRCTEAAREIKELIDTSVSTVDAGNRLAADAGGTMEELVRSVQRVADIIGEVTSAAAQQSEGIGQVNAAVNHLDQMTQQNSALVEQSAAAAASLQDQAGRLAQVVRVFSLPPSEATGLTT